jgi:hypothetical protein
MLKKIILVMVLFALVVPVWAAEDDSAVTPALNRIRTEIFNQGVLSERDGYRVMTKIRAEFQRMERAGVGRAELNEAAAQTCAVVRMMSQNRETMKQVTKVVPVISKAVINGASPSGVGQMVQTNLRECDSIKQAIQRTRDQVRTTERLQQSIRQNNQTRSSGSSSGSNGGGNGGSGNSGGSHGGGSGNSGSSGGSSGGGNGSSGSSSGSGSSGGSGGGGHH